MLFLIHIQVEWKFFSAANLLESIKWLSSKSILYINTIQMNKTSICSSVWIKLQRIQIETKWNRFLATFFAHQHMMFILWSIYSHRSATVFSFIYHPIIVWFPSISCRKIECTTEWRLWICSHERYAAYIHVVYIKNFLVRITESAFEFMNVFIKWQDEQKEGKTVGGIVFKVCGVRMHFALWIYWIARWW